MGTIFLPHTHTCLSMHYTHTYRYILTFSSLYMAWSHFMIIICIHHFPLVYRKNLVIKMDTLSFLFLYFSSYFAQRTCFSLQQNITWGPERRGIIKISIHTYMACSIFIAHLFTLLFIFFQRHIFSTFLSFLKVLLGIIFFLREDEKEEEKMSISLFFKDVIHIYYIWNYYTF